MIALRRLFCCLVLAAAAIGASGGAGAQGRLVADLSKHRVNITLGFTGSDVLLFGATGGKGDVVVVVRGPVGTVVVRRKARVAGIWINRDRRVFESVPAFYTISSSKPLAQIVSLAVAKRHGIGLENLGIHSRDKKLSASESYTFRAALLRIRRANALYSAPQGRGACSDKSLVDEPGSVRFLGERLFRTTVCFPSNVTVGTYLVQVF
ncbi:MAG: TIGR02186 family protein, partial [Alphaproteobacteria bacterium]